MILDAQIFSRLFRNWSLGPLGPFTTPLRLFTASATPLPATFTTPLRPLRRLYNLRMLLCEAKFAMVEAYTLADEVETMVHLTTLHYDSSCMMPLAFCLGKL